MKKGRSFKSINKFNMHSRETDSEIVMDHRLNANLIFNYSLKNMELGPES